MGVSCQMRRRRKFWDLRPVFHWFPFRNHVFRVSKPQNFRLRRLWTWESTLKWSEPIKNEHRRRRRRKFFGGPFWKKPPPLGNEKLKLVLPSHANSHPADYGRSKVETLVWHCISTIISIYRSIYRSMHRPVRSTFASTVAETQYFVPS